MTIKYIYVASPYSLGETNSNVRTNLLATNILMEHDFIPFAPLLSHFWDFYSPKSWQAWADYDLAWLARCDAVLRLPGESRGADAEVKYANELGISVFYNMVSLLLARDKT